MSKSESARIILDEWTASLASRDRSNKNLKFNFEELFQSWKDCGAEFHDLYSSLLKEAIKAHQPSDYVTRKVYQACKKTVKKFDKSEKEFISDWNKNIENIATTSFFEFFPSPVVSLPKEKIVPNHGNMTATEYKAQRKYADQFPILDTTELEARWNDRQYNLDIEDMIKNVLGSEDEANSRAN
jgi:hypothetical protein